MPSVQWAELGRRADGPVRARPPAAKLGQCEVGSELPAAVPNGTPVAVQIIGEGDGVAGHLAGRPLAETPADQDTLVTQPPEELRFAARSGRRRLDCASQKRAGR
jgi:hypothetical protein